MTVSPSTPPPFDTAQALRLARETFEIEAAALTGLAARVDERFAQAVQMVLATTGRLVVMGMGKSGHVGRKMAATCILCAPRRGQPRRSGHGHWRRCGAGHLQQRRER